MDDSIEEAANAGTMWPPAVDADQDLSPTSPTSPQTPTQDLSASSNTNATITSTTPISPSPSPSTQPQSQVPITPAPRPSISFANFTKRAASLASPAGILAALRGGAMAEADYDDSSEEEERIISELNESLTALSPLSPDETLEEEGLTGDVESWKRVVVSRVMNKALMTKVFAAWRRTAELTRLERDAAERAKAVEKQKALIEERSAQVEAQQAILSRHAKELARLNQMVQEGAAREEAHIRAAQHLRDETVAKLKAANIRKLTTNLASFILAAAIGLLLYYNYLLFSPYATALMWSMLVAVALSGPTDILTSVLIQLDEKAVALLPPKNRMIASILPLYVIITFGLIKADSLWSVITSLLITIAIIALIQTDRRSLASLTIVISSVVGFAVPAVLCSVQAINEAVAATKAFSAWIEVNPIAQAAIADFETSPLYIYPVSWAQDWGIDTSDWTLPVLEEAVTDLIVGVSQHVYVVAGGAVSFAGNLGHGAFSFVVFVTSMFYMLTYMTEMRATLEALSPLSQEDNSKLYQSLKQSISRIFVCSLAIGSMHALTTWLAFTIVGLDFRMIASLASAFLATMPVLSSAVLWLPISAYLYTTGEVTNALIIAGMHWAAGNLDSAILSFIPGGNSSVISMSIAAGIYAFGLGGAALGPLLTGITVTVSDIYLTNQHAALTESVAAHPTSPRGSSSGRSFFPTTPRSPRQPQTPFVPHLSTPAPFVQGAKATKVKPE